MARTARRAGIYIGDGGARPKVSAHFADLAVFTRLVAERDPVEVTWMVNAYFEVALPPSFCARL
jgi:hypothetical protein